MNGGQLSAFNNGAGVSAAAADYFFAALFAAAVIALLARIMQQGYSAWATGSLKAESLLWIIGGSVTVASMGLFLIR